MNNRYKIIKLFFFSLCLLGSSSGSAGPLKTESILNPVEIGYLAQSGRQASYADEKINVIEVKNPLQLGKLTALSFLHWVEHHPDGVIAISVSKTQSSFIEYLHYFKRHWYDAEVQQELAAYGIDTGHFPSTNRLKFVQVSEFYPVDPRHPFYFRQYLEQHLLSLLDISQENILLMDFDFGILKEKGSNIVFRDTKVDLSLLNRAARNRYELWQQQALNEALKYSRQYEKKILAWGGIDLFIGRIGSDAHVAFNMPGSAFDSRTRLERLSYSTAAQLADDLGGIQNTRNRVMMTLGLETITHKKTADIIILASGSLKAGLMKEAVQGKPSVKIPATYFQKIPRARFYISEVTARMLTTRYIEDLKQELQNNPTAAIQKIVIDISLHEKTPILQLKHEQISKHAVGRLLLSKISQPWYELLESTYQKIIEDLNRGLSLQPNNKFMHISLLHDDLLHTTASNQIFKNNRHLFVYLRNDSHVVSNEYLNVTIGNLNDWWLDKVNSDIFNKKDSQIFRRFARNYHKMKVEDLQKFDALCLVRSLVKVYQINNLIELKRKIRWLKDEYFTGQLKGEVELDEIKKLKLVVHDCELAKLWAVRNVNLANIIHLDTNVNAYEVNHGLNYQPNLITSIGEVVQKEHPNVITVVDNDMTIGADAYYQVIQLLDSTLHTYPNSQLNIWGYRTMGQRYRFDEANVILPLSKEDMKLQKKIFNDCFASQQYLTHPSPHYDGNSVSLSYEIQKNQLADLTVLLGKSFLATHPNEQVKNAKGLVLIRQLSSDHFNQYAKNLHDSIIIDEDLIS